MKKIRKKEAVHSTIRELDEGDWEIDQRLSFGSLSEVKFLVDKNIGKCRKHRSFQL